MAKILNLKELGDFETLAFNDMGDGVLSLALNRPKSGNAMNWKMVLELNQLLDKLQDLEGLRVVVLTGNGKHFCTGLDLR